jgi:tRNA threonylcarbamoyladenosine biosynthesis protein TsaE
MSLLTLEWFLDTEAALLQWAAAIAKLIPAGTVIFLYGPLGVGKTTLTRGFLQALGYQGKVKSPTYTLVETYLIAGKAINHFDCYRLQHPQELEHIGIYEYFSPETICLIEWPECGLGFLPQADLSCTLSFHHQGRTLCVQALSAKGEKILKEVLF